MGPGEASRCRGPSCWPARCWPRSPRRPRRELNAVGVTVGSLGNPFFGAIGKGATEAARHVNPKVKITVNSADYDLNKQFTQIDNFIASGVDLILVNAAW